MANWEVLKKRKVIDLMIGDSIVINDIFDYRMPYLTGKKICELSEKIGLKIIYNTKNAKSRWQYMEELIDFSIRNNKINLLFKELFALKNFEDVKKIGEYRSSNEIYYNILNDFFVRINEILFFEECHIEYNLETWSFSLVDDNKNIKIVTKVMDKINIDYIKGLKIEIDSAIKNKDYESAITKGKTMVEEVLKYGLEIKNVEYSPSVNMQELLRTFKENYNMHSNKEMDKRINDLLSGLTKIVNSICEMRKNSSDSHGAGSKRIRIKEHHAILYANSAITISEFLLSVIENSK